MKLLVTIVTDADEIEDAISEYNYIEEKWAIVNTKLDGKDWHPMMEEGG